LACAIILCACAQGIETPIDPTGVGGGGGSSTTGNPPTSGTGFYSTVGSGGSSATSTGSGGSASTTAGVGGAAGTPSGSGGTATTVGVGGSAGATTGGGNAGNGGSAGSGGSAGNGGRAGNGGSAGNGGRAGNGGSAGTGGSAGNGGAGGAGGQPPLKPTSVVIGTSAPVAEQSGSSTGGGAYNQDCPANQVLIGLTGTSIPVDGGTSYPRSLQAVCGTLSIAGNGPYTVTTTRAGNLAQVGTPPNPNVPLTGMCGTNQVVVAFDSRSGLFMDQITLQCAPLTISGTSPTFSIAPGAANSAPPVGGLGGGGTTARPRSNCPAGQVAVGNHGRAGSAIDAFGISCAMPSLIVQ